MIFIVDESIQSAHPKSTDLAGANPSVLLRDIAYNQIKEAIRLAELRPGEPLSETRLSKQLGISRTPVREALQVLAQEGLVQIIPGRAVTVAAPSVQEVMDALHIRWLLEPELARLAARSITPSQLAELYAILEELEDAVARNDWATWSATDNSFHEALSKACPNRLLGELSLQIRNRISYLSIDVHDDLASMAARTKEHRVIVERIAAGDSDGAAAAMCEHISTLRENTLRRLIHNYG